MTALDSQLKRPSFLCLQYPTAAVPEEKWERNKFLNTLITIKQISLLLNMLIKQNLKKEKKEQGVNENFSNASLYDIAMHVQDW